MKAYQLRCRGNFGWRLFRELGLPGEEPPMEGDVIQADERVAQILILRGLVEAEPGQPDLPPYDPSKHAMLDNRPKPTDWERVDYAKQSGAVDPWAKQGP